MMGHKSIIASPHHDSRCRSNNEMAPIAEKPERLVTFQRRLDRLQGRFAESLKRLAKLPDGQEIALQAQREMEKRAAAAMQADALTGGAIQRAGNRSDSPFLSKRARGFLRAPPRDDGRLYRTGDDNEQLPQQQPQQPQQPQQQPFHRNTTRTQRPRGNVVRVLLLVYHHCVLQCGSKLTLCSPGLYRGVSHHSKVGSVCHCSHGYLQPRPLSKSRRRCMRSQRRLQMKKRQR